MLLIKTPFVLTVRADRLPPTVEPTLYRRPDFYRSPDFTAHRFNLAHSVDSVGLHDFYPMAGDLTWLVRQDFRKVAAEAEMTARFAESITRLHQLLATPQPSPFLHHLLEEGEAGRVRFDVLSRLLDGISLRSLLSEIQIDQDVPVPLLFGTEAIAVENPLLSRLRSYIRVDRRVSADTLIALIALLLQLQSCSDARQTKGIPQSLTCSLSRDMPQQSVLVSKRSTKEYESQLKARGIRGAQEFLKALQCDPGPIDGKNGPRTQSAVEQFCRSEGVFCPDVSSKIFEETVIDAMARTYPIVRSR